MRALKDESTISEVTFREEWFDETRAGSNEIKDLSLRSGFVEEMRSYLDGPLDEIRAISTV